MIAIACIYIVNEIRKQSFWKREKIWRTKYETDVLNTIVNPIEKMITERKLNK